MSVLCFSVFTLKQLPHPRKVVEEALLTGLGEMCGVQGSTYTPTHGSEEGGVHPFIRSPRIRELENPQLYEGTPET